MLWLLAVLCVGLVASEESSNVRKSYDGYQVFDILPKSAEEVRYLQDLMVTTDYLDFWQEPSRVGVNATVMVGPAKVRPLLVALRKQNIHFEKSISNVQTILDPVWADIDRRQKAGMVFNINDYNTLSDIYGWMLQLASECRTGLTCQVNNVGNSHNGNPILVFSITQGGANRRGYWIDSTIHAREWIAPATVLQVLDTLARGTTASAINLTDRYNWYIMPVMNPDGYLWTWSNDRMWRKNRRPNAGSTCIGTDLNRNFNFRWGLQGVSHNPCGETYCGPSGGSEPETQVVQNELMRLAPTLLAMVTVHSYGNMWMFPWGNTVNYVGNTCDRVPDHAELMRVAVATANAIQATYNTNWSRGNSCEVIYETTGGTDDWAKGVANIKYAFCPELRGNSFAIANTNIPLSFNEFYNGIVAMVNAIDG